MKSLVLVLSFFIYINISANIQNISNSKKYDIYENYKKVGLESYKTQKDKLFIVNIKLSLNIKSSLHQFLYNISYSKSDLKKKIYLELKVDKLKKSYYKFDKNFKFKDSENYQFIKIPKNTFIIEPLIVSTLYPILDKKTKKVDVFIPSKNEVIKAKLSFSGVEGKKIGKFNYFLERYSISYKNQSFEVFVDKLGNIVYVDWSSFGYYSQINNEKIISFESKKIKKTYKLKVKNLKLNKFPVKLYYYNSLKNSAVKKNKKILFIDGRMFPKIKNANLDVLAENIFFDKLVNKLTKKGYSILRYSFEDFSKKQIKSLTLSKKYKILQKLFIKNKSYTTVLSIGWGSLLVFKLNQEFKNRMKKIILLNPMYSSYLSVLKSQTDLEFFGLKKQNQLKNTLKKLIKKVYKNKEFIFNGVLVNSQYFKDLFEFKPDTNTKVSKATKVFVMAGSYDSEINSKNAWFLYSNIKNNDVKYKEFTGLNHYFYKIPYKSFAFSYNKNLKINRDFLKELKRFLRK